MIRARAPLRLGLAGGGTDVSPFPEEYGGCVLNATIGLHAYAYLQQSVDGRRRFISTDLGRQEVEPAEEECSIDGELRLHRGVYRRVVQEFNKGKPLSVTLTTHCDVPAGSGLGSSSTVVVAMIKSFVEYMQLPLGEYEVAKLAFDIERNELGMTGGRQDQYAATFGGFNFMEFDGGDRVVVNPLRVKHWIVSELEARTILFDTGTSRVSSALISGQIDNVRAGQRKSIDALRGLKADAVAMKAALLRGDMGSFAEILDHSWQQKKQTTHGVTNSRLDEIYDAARVAGAIAGKVSGAGGGGFMMFVADPLRKAAVIEALRRQSGRIIPFSFCEQGTQGWRVPG